MSEQVIREDERQACWEDFMCLLDAERGSPARSLKRRLWILGWKDLGTGDGKPQHRIESSHVHKWLAERGKPPAGGEK